MFDNVLNHYVYNTVGDRIRKAREEKGWSQEDLALKMGYANKSSVAQIESSGNNVTLKKVEKCAEALGVSASYLMGWNNVPIEISQEDNAIHSDRDSKYTLGYAIEILKTNLPNAEEEEMLYAYRKAAPNVQQAIRTLLGL